MSLEQQLESLKHAIEALTATMQQQSVAQETAKPSPKPQAKPAAKKEAAPANEAPAFTKDDVRAALQALVEDKGKNAGIAIMKEFKVRNINELNVEEYANVIKVANNYKEAA
ncbi:hypothetical protein [Algicola sagamiensis]|uniref:hypothetical protein n=1 Tax=Algicola sagamiensis TaxID=163869 RepID=UPI0003742F44|nr:hypothetical protein [Algicola sagamiensis]